MVGIWLWERGEDKTHTCTRTNADVELPGTSPNIENGGVDSSNVRLLCAERNASMRLAIVLSEVPNAGCRKVKDE